MEIRYQREIRHNYLIIKIEREEDDYESRMAEENSVNGFLPLSVKEQGRERELYYEITSRQPLSRMVERKAMRGEELRHLILGIAGAVEEMGKYLLGEEHILLEPDFIYIEPQNYTISLCFVPGYRGSFPDALGKLTEYLLGKVSHDDREGVVLAYELFQATKQENYGIRDLLRILYQPPDGGKDLSGVEALLWEEENGIRKAGEGEEEFSGPIPEEAEGEGGERLADDLSRGRRRARGGALFPLRGGLRGYGRLGDAAALRCGHGGASWQAGGKGRAEAGEPRRERDHRNTVFPLFDRKTGGAGGLCSGERYGQPPPREN